jgi:hypothetical protein
MRPQPTAPSTVRLTLDDDIIELLIATGFAEVWLAKEGHDGKVFINFLNKIELPLIYVLYGAMLAGVDGVTGAGNPCGLPSICARDWRNTPRSTATCRFIAMPAALHRQLRPALAGGARGGCSVRLSAIVEDWSRRWPRAPTERPDLRDRTPREATTPTPSARSDETY